MLQLTKIVLLVIISAADSIFGEKKYLCQIEIRVPESFKRYS